MYLIFHKEPMNRRPLNEEIKRNNIEKSFLQKNTPL